METKLLTANGDFPSRRAHTYTQIESIKEHYEVFLTVLLGWELLTCLSK